MMCGEEHGEEIFSMKKRITAALGVLFLLTLLPCAAWAEELLVGGQAVGIEISADGVIVSGFCEVQTEKGVVCPAREAGFAVGDLIVGMDGAPIRSAEDLIAASAALGGGEAEVEILRGGESRRLRVRPALSETRQWLLGLWETALGLWGHLPCPQRFQGSGDPRPPLPQAQVVSQHQGWGELSGPCSSSASVLGGAGRRGNMRQHPQGGRAAAAQPHRGRFLPRSLSKVPVRTQGRGPGPW
jgi:hypothetical protein